MATTVNGVEVGATSYTTTNSILENENGKLDKDAFLKLFLTELQYQDPTEPMDSDKILTQTSQLTQLEAQEELKNAMESITAAMEATQESNAQLVEMQTQMQEALQSMSDSIVASSGASVFNKYNTVAMIGKTVESDIDGVNLEDNSNTYFELYFDEAIDTTKTGSVTITDEDGNVVRNIDISELNGKSGLVGFNWDTKDDNGEYVETGQTYKIYSNYNVDEEAGTSAYTRVGRGKVDSVMYDNGEPYIKMGSMILPIDSAIEFY